MERCRTPSVSSVVGWDLGGVGHQRFIGGFCLGRSLKDTQKTQNSGILLKITLFYLYLYFIVIVFFGVHLSKGGYFDLFFGV